MGQWAVFSQGPPDKVTPAKRQRNHFWSRKIASVVFPETREKEAFKKEGIIIRSNITESLRRINLRRKKVQNKVNEKKYRCSTFINLIFFNFR